MNRLQHIRGMNVSRRVPFNAVLPSGYRQRTDIFFENRHLSSQVPGPDQLSVAKKNHDAGIKCKQFYRDHLRLVLKGSKTICKQRGKIKSSVTSLKKKSSLHKKLSLKSIVKVCHYSTYQNVKFNSSEFNKRKSQIAAVINDTNSINHHGSFVTSVEKYPRSYAEMIADYSEALYKVSAVGVRNDSLYFDNTIRKTPFNTFSTPSSVKKIVNVTNKHNGVEIEGKENYSSLTADVIESFDRCIQRDNIKIVECHDSQHHDTDIAKARNKVTSQDCDITSDLNNDDNSYAKSVTDSGKSMDSISHTSIANGGPILSRNILARNSLRSFAAPRKTNSTNTQEALRKASLTVASIPSEKNIKEQLIVTKKHNWLEEIESVTNDLKSVIEKRTARAVNVTELKESDISQFDTHDTFDKPLHKIHRLKKLIEAHKEKEKNIAVKTLGYQAEKIGKMKGRNKDFALQKHNYSQLSDKTSNPQQYFSNVTSSPARKNSTNVPNSRNITTEKQPQVKLRMVPSEKESVVSINVDSIATGLLDSLNPVSKQLSVVVQSDQKENPQSMGNQSNVPTLRQSAKSAPQSNDFGPMRISISEDSAPIKQIEFSINGKPVSELKSITARTERLDVVSSMDKIEIRIPFAKDDANAPSKIEEADLSKEIDSSTGQILNVQISANFQNKPTKSGVMQSRETTQYDYNKNIRSVSPSLISKNYYSFNEPAKTREDSFSENNIKPHGFPNRIDIKSDNRVEKNINEYNISDDIKLQHKTAKNLLTDKTMTHGSLIEEKNYPENRISNTKKIMNTLRSPTNKYDKNESFDQRIPSKMIPWWSTSDSFKKIKKIEEDLKPLAPSNRKEKNVISNLNHNFVTKLPSKWKETSNSTTLTTKIQSMNDATITMNNSNSLTSYSNSVESKPTLQCSYPFRLKPNKINPDAISNIIRNDLKTKYNQMPIVQEDKKICRITQTKSIPLSASDATNIGDRNISKKEKTSVSQKKTLNSSQNLSSKSNREKKDNYFLKRTMSIDDVFGVKSKTENTSDTLKLIEKRKGALFDDGLKISSRKSTIKLNNPGREIENLPAGTITTKDLISNIEISKQIVKTIPEKQKKLDTTKKLEIKTNILKQKENLTVTNVGALDVKLQNKNDIKNIQQIHQHDTTSASSASNHKNFLKSTQTLKKQDKATQNTIVFQDNPNQKESPLLNYNKDKPSSSSNIRNINKSEQLGLLVKITPEESKQNKPNISNIKSTSKTNEEIVKLETLLKSAESLDKKTINQKNSPLQIINEIQTKNNINTNEIANIDHQSQKNFNLKIITSKIKDHVVYKTLVDKNAKEISNKIVKKIDKKNEEDKIATIVTQNPKSKNLLRKNCEKDYLNKSKFGNDKKNPSADSLSRKPNSSTGFKSADSKMKSIVMSSHNCAYEKRSMLMESLYPNFNRRGDTMSHSQAAVFKNPRNLHNDMLEHRAARIIGSAEPWINIDRPEKNMLYSAWLQRPRNDIQQE